jgi:TolB-like protein
MTKQIFVIFYFIFSAATFSKDAVNVAVLKLDNAGLRSNEVTLLTNRLQSEFVKTGSYNVIERAKIDKMLMEQKFQLGDLSADNFISIGNILGAQQILVGSAGKFNSIYTLSVRLIDAETGLNIRSADFDSEGDVDILYKEGIKAIAIELSGKRGLARKYKKEQKEKLRAEQRYNKEQDKIRGKEAKESKKWDISIGMSNGFAPLIETKQFRNVNPNGFYFTGTPNSTIFNLNLRRSYGIVYSSFSAIFGYMDARFDSTKAEEEVFYGEEKLDSQDFEMFLFGVGGQLNFFRLLFLETNFFISDGIGIHGFAGLSLEGILYSILGRSMNVKIGPEIFYTNQIISDSWNYYDGDKLGPTTWTALTCRLEFLLNL